MLVLQQAVCEDENIFNRIRRQLPRYHYGNSLSRKPYSENFTNLFLPDHSNQGFFFQLDVPFWERNIFRADFENDFENSFNEMCCRFEDRFLKDFSVLTEVPNYPSINKIFLLDLSSQMSPDEWSHIQESLMLMMDNMCLGNESYKETEQESDGQMVTLMSSDGKVKQYHKESLEVEKIKQDIVHLQGHKRISCTTTLLKKAYTYIDQYSDSSKSNTKHEVLLITDSRSTCRLPYHIEARQLRSVAHVSVVTITRNDSPQGKIRVTDIASESSTDNIYSFQSCKSLLDMMKHINGSPCRKCQRIGTK